MLLDDFITTAQEQPLTTIFLLSIFTALTLRNLYRLHLRLQKIE